MRILIFIFLCLIWGSTWMAIKIGLSTAPPLWGASIRFIVAIVILYGIILIKRYHLPKKIKDLLRIGYPGIFAYGISYALVYIAEQYINSAMTAVLFASFPLFVALLSLKLLKEEKVKPLAWIGLIFGFLGIVVISLDSLQISQYLFLGAILAVTASLASSYATVLIRRTIKGENIIVTLAIQMSLGCIILVISALIFEDIRDFQIVAETVGSILYLAVLGTVTAFFGYYWLLARTKAVVVSLITFVAPIISILIGMVGFSETFSNGVILGSAMILSGVLMVIRK